MHTTEKGGGQTMQPYELIRSGRRTLALELRGGRVIVRAPYRRLKR